MFMSNFLKIYYSFLFILLTILIVSYEYVAEGDMIFFGNITLFYLIPLFLVPLLYYFLFTKNEYFGKINCIFVFLFCIGLGLSTVITIYKFPLDLDSIFTAQSVLLILGKGFSTQFFNGANLDDFLLKATYPLPITSILASNLSLLTGISFMEIVKYLTLIIMMLFFVVYYAFLSKSFNKRVALVSLIILVSFPTINGATGTFQNNVLSYFFVLSVWWLLFNFYFSGRKSVGLSLIIMILISAFVLTHHLTFSVFIFSLVVISVLIFIIKLIDADCMDLIIPNNIVNLVIIATVFAIAYYTFVYFGPIEIMVKSFTQQISNEASNIKTVSEWTYNIIIQRLAFVIFLSISTIFAALSVKKIFEIKKSTNHYVLNKNIIFLLLGISILAVSVLGTFLHFPYNWDRTSIFGWMFIIPVTMVLIYEYNLKNKFVKLILVLLIAFLIFGNIYVIPQNYLDHNGDAKYAGQYKNWETMQEHVSAEWLIANSVNRTFSLDETFRRVYIVTDPVSYGKNYSYGSIMSNLTFTELTNNYNVTKFSYLILRSENRFFVTGGFFSRDSPKKLSLDTINRMFTDPRLDVIYDNNEMRVFYSS